MVSVDRISQHALERIGLEDSEYDNQRRRALSSTWEGRDVQSVRTVRVEPGIQGRPMPVLTGRVQDERLWWDPRRGEWVAKPDDPTH